MVRVGKSSRRGSTEHKNAQHLIIWFCAKGMFKWFDIQRSWIKLLYKMRVILKIIFSGDPDRIEVIERFARAYPLQYLLQTQKKKGRYHRNGNKTKNDFSDHMHRAGGFVLSNCAKYRGSQCRARWSEEIARDGHGAKTNDSSNVCIRTFYPTKRSPSIVDIPDSLLVPPADSYTSGERR